MLNSVLTEKTVRISPRLRDHIAPTFALAWPVVVTRSSVHVMVAVDVAMVGHLGGPALAFVAVAMAPQALMALMAHGMLHGTSVLISQSHGAGEEQKCGAIWRMAMLHALVLGMILGLLCLLGESMYLAAGYQAEIATGGGLVLLHYAWGMPAKTMTGAVTFFLEGVGRPKVGMVVMMVANLINLLLNWMFIYGHLGAPGMGAAGVAVSTSLLRWVLLAVLVGYLFAMPGSREFGIRGGRLAAASVGRTLRRLGYPFGLAHGLEAGAFSALVVLAAWFGTEAAAGYQIAQSLIALGFRGAIGFGVAGAVRVGRAIGRQDHTEATMAGWTGVGMATLSVGMISAAFILWPGILSKIYTSDQSVLGIAQAAIMIAGVVLFFDGLQGVLVGLLRAMGDAWTPVFIHAVAFWGVALPTAVWFGFVMDYGANGLMWGMACGVACAALIALARFHQLSRRGVARLQDI